MHSIGKLMQASSEVILTGAAGQDVIYYPMNLVLTTGTWLITGSAAIATHVADSCCLAIYDGVRAVIRGPTGSSSAANLPAPFMVVGFLPVKTTVSIFLLAQRNGGSALTVGTSTPMNPSQNLNALRVL